MLTPFTKHLFNTKREKYDQLILELLQTITIKRIICSFLKNLVSKRPFFLLVKCKRSFQVSASFVRKKVHCMPIITALHLREIMSKFRRKRKFRSAPGKESIMAWSILGSFEFDNISLVIFDKNLTKFYAKVRKKIEENTKPTHFALCRYHATGISAENIIRHPSAGKMSEMSRPKKFAQQSSAVHSSRRRTIWEWRKIWKSQWCCLYKRYFKDLADYLGLNR